MSVWIEKSPSSRAECKICYKNIHKGELRVGDIHKGELRVGGDLGSGKYQYYYHLGCFVKVNWEFIKDLVRHVLSDYCGEDLVTSILIAMEMEP